MYKYIAVLCAVLIDSHARSFYYDHQGHQYDVRQNVIVHQPVARSYSYRIDRFSKPTNDLVYVPVALQAWRHAILAIPLVYFKERQEVAKELDQMKVDDDKGIQEVTNKPDPIEMPDDNTKEVVKEADLMETLEKVDDPVTDKDLASTINELEVMSEQTSSSEAATEKSEESIDS